jgi:hypothetical protein
MQSVGYPDSLVTFLEDSTIEHEGYAQCSFLGGLQRDDVNVLH